MNDKTSYREAILPGIGRLWVPSDLTDEEVQEQIIGADEAVPKKAKSKKKS